jgi:thiamine biosynthesis lipoprotein
MLVARMERNVMRDRRPLISSGLRDDCLIRRAKPLLGTFVEIAVNGVAGAQGETAIDAAFAAVARVHALMSFHDSDSDVSRLNAGAGDAVAIDGWTCTVLQAAIELNHLSNGLFDVGVAPVLQRLGMLPAAPTRSRAGPASLSRDAFEILPDGLARLQLDTRIDLGGIAKGFAVDRAVAVLQERGIQSGLVNAGGDLKVFGANGRTIHIRDPRDPAALLDVVVLRDQALATSAGRCDPLRGRNIGECAIIDPGSRAPVQALRGASVCAASCMIADALTKVVMISGEGAGAVLEHYGASALFVTDAGEIYATTDWQAGRAD